MLRFGKAQLSWVHFSEVPKVTCCCLSFWQTIQKNYFLANWEERKRVFFLSFGEFRQELTEIQLNKLLYAQPPLHKTIWLSCLVTPLHDSKQCYGTDPNWDMQWYLPPGPSLSSGTASGRPCQNSQAHGRAGRACHTSSMPACNSSRSGQSLGLSHHK